MAQWNFVWLTALVTAVYQLSFFIVAAGLKIDKVTDFAGTTNFIVLALLTLVLQGEYAPRQVLLTALVVVWGTRLALFLLFRILMWGEDRRFDTTRNDPIKFAGFWIFQALWVWTVTLPVTIVNQVPSPPPPGAGAYVGVSMWALGLVVEAVADWQKLQHKKGEGGQASWCHVGVWQWSRHPNYFGEILLWLGVFVASAGVLSGWQWVAVLSPLFTASILLFLSGVPILEASADKKYGGRQDYLQYKRRTSVLIPLPPAVYAPLPQWIKTWVLLDLPLYNAALTSPAPPSDSMQAPLNAE